MKPSPDTTPNHDVMPAKAGIHPPVVLALLSARMGSGVESRVRGNDPVAAEGPGERNSQ